MLFCLHPPIRAFDLTGGTVSKAKINIEKIHARGILGVDEWEREYHQDILVSLALTVDVGQVQQTDRVEDTVNYRTLKKEVLEHVDREKRRTVEALATDLLQLCLEKERVREATVRVEKPDALRGAEGVSVEISGT